MNALSVIKYNYHPIRTTTELNMSEQHNQYLVQIPKEGINVLLDLLSTITEQMLPGMGIELDFEVQGTELTSQVVRTNNYLNMVVSGGIGGAHIQYRFNDIRDSDLRIFATQERLTDTMFIMTNECPRLFTIYTPPLIAGAGSTQLMIPDVTEEKYFQMSTVYNFPISFEDLLYVQNNPKVLPQNSVYFRINSWSADYCTEVLKKFSTEFKRYITKE